MSRGLCSSLSDTNGTAATVRHHARCEGRHPQSMRFGDVSTGEGGAGTRLQEKVGRFTIGAPTAGSSL